MLRNALKSLLCGFLLCVLSSCGSEPVRSPAIPSSPLMAQSRIGRGPAVPLPMDIPATLSATPPRPWERYAFVTHDLHLALYERSTEITRSYPAAGEPVLGVGEPVPELITFDDGRNVYAYDVNTEELVRLVDGQEVGGFAFNASSDEHGNFYFLGTSDPVKAAARIGHAYAKFMPPGASGTLAQRILGPYLGKPVFLTPVNLVGGLSGDIQSLRPSRPGDLYIFTTVEGRVYLYDTVDGMMQALRPNQEFDKENHAVDARIDQVTGRYAAWIEDRQRLVVLDRWNGLMGPVPFLGQEATASIFTLKFLDAFTLIFRSGYSDDQIRLVTYNLLNGTFDNLPVANMADDDF